MKNSFVRAIMRVKIVMDEKIKGEGMELRTTPLKSRAACNLSESWAICSTGK